MGAVVPTRQSVSVSQVETEDATDSIPDTKRTENKAKLTITEELQRADQEDVIVLRGPKKEKKVIKVMEEEEEEIPQEELVKKKKTIKKVIRHKGLEDFETPEEVESLHTIDGEEINLESVNVRDEMQKASVFKPKVQEIQEPDNITESITIKRPKQKTKEHLEEFS